MKGKVNCTCGWSWNKSDSSAKDMYICHECGRDNSNNMKNGGWLDNIPQAQEGTQTMNSRQKKGVELLLKETEKEKKDQKEFSNTYQVKNPRSIKFKKQKEELQKKQTYVTQDNRTDAVKKYDDEKGKAKEAKKQFKKNVVAPLDVATDIMQLGNFVPNPIAQTIGGIGNIAGAGIDAYQAYDDLSEGNYTDAAINAGSVFLPMALGSQTFRRNSKYLQPGQPLYPFSPQARNNFIDRAHYIEPFNKVKGMTDTSLLANRALLGTLGAETLYDIPKEKNGGWLDNYNDSQASAPEGMVGDGFSNVGRNYSPAWGGQFEDGGLVPIAQGGKATRADSLDVYNRALKIDAYYEGLRKKGWYPTKEVYPNTGLTSKDLEREMKKIDKESRFTYKEQSKEKKGEGYLNDAYPNTDPKRVNQKALAEHIALTKGTKYATKDNFPSIIDPMAPTTVIDTRIIPKERVTYYDRQASAEKKMFKANPNMTDKDWVKWSAVNDKKFKNTSPPGGSITSLYRYDPLSVKPWDMLTDAEKKARVEKYGTDGVPKSYIDKNKPQDKPDKKDKTDKQRPKLEAIVNNLQPQVVNSDFDVTAQLPIIRKPVVNPKSYDVNSQRQTMSGPSDYYDYNDEEVDLTAAIKSKKAADAYNKYAQEKYKEAAKTNPKAQERLDRLKQNVEIVPNYQTGGSLPGATGSMYARVGAPSNGPYAKKTMPSAQVGKKIKIKDERGLVMKPSESTAVKRKDFDLMQSKDNKAYISAVAAQKKEAARRAKLTKDQREREDYNAYNEERGSISKYTPESTWQRTKAIVSNPMTAAGYVARGENLPGNFQAGPRNAHDYAVDWINPLQGAAALSEIPGELGRGEFLEAGLSGLDALDLGPYARGAMKVAKPLMKPIKKTLAKGALKTFEKARDLEKFGKGKVEDLKMLANDAARSVDDNFIYPIKYRKQIADVKKLHNNLSTELGSDEAAKRLSGVLGIDTSNLNYPSLTTRPRMGSHYNSQSNNINMDFRQLNEFKNSDDYMLSPNTVYDHEVGHWMQTEAYKNSPDYARELDNHKQELADYEKQLSLYNSPGNKALENTNHDNATQEELRHWFLNYIPKPYKPRAPFPTAAPTKIDRFAQQLYGYDKGTNMINIDKVSNPIDTNMLESNARYFTKRGVEPLAHLREMRQNMLTKDYIKDKYGPISEETINKFVSENPTDRVSSFTIPGSNQIKGLADIFRNLPSVVGPSAIGAGAVGTAAYQMQDEEPLPGMRGGGVIRDDRGQWDHPGEITEIDSPYITMQGVPYPVLGISDTGDTQMMYPEEEYEFDGEKVTEYPMARNGRRQEQKGLVNLDQLTNFTNYNKPQPGGWLNKYN